MLLPIVIVAVAALLWMTQGPPGAPRSQQATIISRFLGTASVVIGAGLWVILAVVGTLLHQMPRGGGREDGIAYVWYLLFSGLPAALGLVAGVLGVLSRHDGLATTGIGLNGVYLVLYLLTPVLGRLFS